MINKPESYCVVNAHKQDSISRGKVISYYLSFLIQCVLNQQANENKENTINKADTFIAPNCSVCVTVYIYDIRVRAALDICCTRDIIVLFCTHVHYNCK